MKQIRGTFLTGILVLVPLLATLDILRWFFQAVDNMVRNYLPTFLFPFDFHGLGALSALALILLVGLLTQNYVGKWLVALLDRGIRRIRVIGGLYGGIKKFIETVINPHSDRFHGVVLVEFPREGVFSVGFRTGHPDAKLERAIAPTGSASDPLVNIFVPCTPNPTSGFYLVVRESALRPLDMPVPEAFKILISMGIVSNDPESHA